MFAPLRLSSFLLVGLIVSAPVIACADDFTPFVAEVSADALMVRSGPSRNYYPVTKLSAGDRVQVVGEESGWYAIVPPDDCFSLISQDYVDAAEGGRTGVVNGNAVRVRAGSRLDPKKYAVQRKLSKGAEVEILGDDGEGYYKIVPPDGAVVWLHGDFVTKVGDQQWVAKPETKRDPIPAAAPKAEPSPIDLVRRSNPPSDRKAYEAPVQPISEPVDSASTSTVPPTAREVEPTDWSRSVVSVAETPSPAETSKVVRSVPPPTSSVDTSVESAESGIQHEQTSGDSGVVYSFAPDATEADRVAVMKNSKESPSPVAKDRTASDQPASSTPQEFVLSEAPLQPAPVIERPDPYAGIDVHREDGVIKVVVDPIEPGQELTVEQYRRRLMDLDEVFKSQLEKPAHQRDYVGLRDGFTELSAQDVDMYTRLYAARRIEQINALEDASLAMVRLESMSDQVTAIRRQHMLERSQLQVPRTPINRGFDAKGELRESLIYSSPVGPRRYRLVDPTQPTPRTLCYVEAAPESDIRLDEYLGQVVGVFAREKYLQTGDVDPIAVVVAEKLIILDRGNAATVTTTTAIQPVAPVQEPGTAPSGYDVAAGAQSATVYQSPYDAQPGIIQPDAMRSESSQYGAPRETPPADNGEMIEMLPMEEYTPVASGNRR